MDSRRRQTALPRSEVFIGAPTPLLFDWLQRRTGIERTPGFRAIGRVVDGELVGVVGFNGQNGASCQMHMAGEGKHWISRKFIREAFRYAFEVCGYNVVFGMVPSGNVAAYDIDIRLGFEEVATIVGAHPDGALHFLVMRREDCRWLT